MSVNVGLVDHKNDRVASLHEHDGEVGLLVYTEPHKVGRISAVPFFNPTFGADLNQDVSFTGTPELINNGGDSAGWTGTAISGAWDFTAAGVGVGGGAAVTITNANNLDTASFTDATETDMSGYTAITGQVNLISYNGALNNIILQMRNNGVDVGNSVNLNEYISTSQLGSYQGFVIPKDLMGLGDFIIDEMRIVVNRSGGVKPIIYFDDMQIEEFGEPLEFIVTAAAGTLFNITDVIISIADTGTGGAAFAYNKIGALSSLPNGLNFNAISNGGSLFSSNIKQNSDLLVAAGTVSDLIDDGTNTFYTVTVKVSEISPVTLDSRQGDSISFVVNDDLTGLDLFNVVAAGSVEVIADR